jgi:zinc transport system substrate-binding protein
MRKTNILILIAALLAGCNNNENQNEKIRIAVSILPQEYFVSKIAGDIFEINVLIPPGASPATYEPTPKQLASLSKTDLYLRLGHTGFEMAWMEKLASANDNMTLVDLSPGIELIIEDAMHGHGHGHAHDHSHHAGGVDPHIWLSPKNVMVIAKNIHQVLSSGYPEHRETFNSNLEVFLHELDTLDRYISHELSGLRSKSFFTYHPSLSYFARDYNLEQHPMELGGKTPSSAHLKKLIDTALEKDIRVIFLQMQYDQKNAEVLAKETGAEIVQINPLAIEWHDQMIFITKKLKQNLQ